MSHQTTLLITNKQPTNKRTRKWNWNWNYHCDLRAASGDGEETQLLGRPFNM